MARHKTQNGRKFCDSLSPFKSAVHNRNTVPCFIVIPQIACCRARCRSSVPRAIPPPPPRTPSDRCLCTDAPCPSSRGFAEGERRLCSAAGALAFVGLRQPHGAEKCVVAILLYRVSSLIIGMGAGFSSVKNTCTGSPPPCQKNDPADAHPSAHKSVLGLANPARTGSVHLDAPGQRHGQQPRLWDGQPPE